MPRGGGGHYPQSLRNLYRAAARTCVTAGSDSGHGQPLLAQSERVHELIEERGCELLYLPPYSSDLNPIEEAFSKVKGLLCEAQARTREALVETLGGALSAVTAQDALGYFEHRGYHASDRPLFAVLVSRT